jgi:hypothetical protein
MFLRFWGIFRRFLLTSFDFHPSPLGKVYLAAQIDRKLTKSLVNQVNIPQASEILSDHILSRLISRYGVPLSMRMSGYLFLGLVRIYSKKLKLLEDDAHELRSRMNLVFSVTSFRSLHFPCSNQMFLPPSVSLLQKSKISGAAKALLPPSQPQFSLLDNPLDIFPAIDLFLSSARRFSIGLPMQPLPPSVNDAISLRQSRDPPPFTGRRPDDSADDEAFLDEHRLDDLVPFNQVFCLVTSLPHSRVSFISLRTSMFLLTSDSLVQSPLGCSTKSPGTRNPRNC